MKWFFRHALLFAAAVIGLLATNFTGARGADFQATSLRAEEVIGIVGGADTTAAQEYGHLEALIAMERPGVKFRNFGWEGDTVFEQPRDYAFPPLAEHLRKAGVTVVFAQFGRMEALGGKASAAEFGAALGKLLKQFAGVTPRLVLFTPPPFENAEAPLPDLSARNTDLEAFAAEIRRVGGERGWPVVDALGALRGSSQQITRDGLQLSPRGHALVAQAAAERMGLGSAVRAAGVPDDLGAWPNAAFEKLRRTIVAKNRLWFDYWRPQNWAFLGGDRTEQPSSRDHRDPKKRWFPEEMEQFRPLIMRKEEEIEALASETKIRK